MQNRPAVPRGTIVNEAIDLAKYFSSVKAGKFVNGVLDKVADKLADAIINAIKSQQITYSAGLVAPSMGGPVTGMFNYTIT